MPELVLAPARNGRVSRWSLPAMLVRDIMMPAIWLRGWLGGTVDWRGNRMMIGTDSSQLEQLPAT